MPEEIFDLEKEKAGGKSAMRDKSGKFTTPKKMTETKKIEFLAEARKRFDRGITADRHNRDNAVDDLNFINGDQWPKKIRKEREDDGRPIITVNDLPVFIDQVVGDQRQNRPGIHVHPDDSNADPETAETIESLIRNIEVTSQASIAYDMAFELMVQCGFGCWRIITEYVDDNNFNQRIKIEPIRNNFSVVFDNTAQKWDKTDGMWCFVYSKISKDVFKEKYPDKQPTSWDIPNISLDWLSEDTVTIAEYFLKELETKAIYQLEDGMITGALSEGQVAKQKRTVETHRISRSLITAFDILEGETLWPSKYWPIVPLDGKEINIDGTVHKRGLIRNAKDPARAYNYSRSLDLETFALAPKAPFMATAKQIQGYEQMWKVLNKKTLPYVLFNPDTQFPGKPERIQPPQVSTAITQSTVLAMDEKRGTVGIFRASLGERSNETSGVAIRARQREGDVGSFAFSDNLARSIELTGWILLDLIPTVYDTERAERVTGVDGRTKLVTLNTSDISPKTGAMERINDVTVGKYGVVVKVGPSYTTQRQEASENMVSIVQAMPQVAPIIGDLLIENMDWPGAQQFSRRLKSWMVMNGMGHFLTPEELEGIPQPPAPQPQQPDPMMMAKMAQEDAKTTQQQLKVELAVLAIEKTKLEMGQMLSNFEINLIKTIEERIGRMVEGGQPGPGPAQPPPVTPQGAPPGVPVS